MRWASLTILDSVFRVVMLHIGAVWAFLLASSGQACICSSFCMLSGSVGLCHVVVATRALMSPAVRVSGTAFNEHHLVVHASGSAPGMAVCLATYCCLHAVAQILSARMADQPVPLGGARLGVSTAPGQLLGFGGHRKQHANRHAKRRTESSVNRAAQQGMAWKCSRDIQAKGPELDVP